MASIRKRGGKWRAQVRRKGHPSESATFTHKAQAEHWARERDSELTAARHGIIPRRTVRQAVERYTRDECPKHRGERWELVRLAKILRGLAFADRDLAAVSRADIASWRDGMTGLAPSSARREYGLLRAVFAVAAREWGWLRVSPFTRVAPPPAGKPRTRRVTDDELAAIAAAAGLEDGARPANASQVIAAATRFAVETAMRQGEILALEASDVAGRTARVRKSKNGDERVVPLSRAALAILATLPAKGRLFPVAAATFDTLFRRLRKAARLDDLHFHDTRREATTRLSRKLDVLTLAKATGHRDVKILLRTYYAPAMSDVAALLD